MTNTIGYYQGGHVAVHPIGGDGSVGGPPIEWLATATGAHAMQTDPTNRYAFVPHIAGNGPNAILQFTFDEHTGRLTPNAPARVEPEAVLGPRHFCFHPSLDILYFSNEQGCSVTGYRLDTATGTLSAFQTITTLPEGYTERNTCSQIQITASGRFLYAPNRGHNSIAWFAVDPTTGQLTATGRAACVSRCSQEQMDMVGPSLTRRKDSEMPDMIPVKIRPLSGEAFRPYGQVLERGGLVYPDTDDGRVAMELLQVRRRPDANQIAQLAIHFSYNQTFIPVQGSMVLVVAPAPDRPSADPRTYAFDYDHAAAFVVEPGQVAFIDKGVWHSLVPVGAACTFVNVTRKNAQEPATEEGNEAHMERIHAARPYVDYVDLQTRDNRVLALEW